MKNDISRLDAQPSARSRRPTFVGGLVVAAAIAMSAGFVGLSECDQRLDAEESQSELRVVRASVTWSEGGRQVSVVRVPEAVREAAPRVVVERRDRRADQPVIGREIRNGVEAVTMLVRLLASGKIDG